MATVNTNILEYMNTRSKKKITMFQLNQIINAIRTELEEREVEGLKINTRTKVGRTILNERTADIANRMLGKDKVTAHEVWLYKVCRAEEYQDRTGKCAWGLKDVRLKLGYDPETGLELEGI